MMHISQAVPAWVMKFYGWIDLKGSAMQMKYKLLNFYAPFEDQMYFGIRLCKNSENAKKDEVVLLNIFYHTPNLSFRVI